MYKLTYRNYHVTKYILFPLFVLTHSAGYAKYYSFTPDDSNDCIKDD